MKDGSLESRELGLRISAEGTVLRLRDARTGKKVLTRKEVAMESAKKAKKAMSKARRAELQLKALEAELTRLRGQVKSPSVGEPELP
jgi:hypothetical protein